MGRQSITVFQGTCSGAGFSAMGLLPRGRHRESLLIRLDHSGQYSVVVSCEQSATGFAQA
jgi:hypothetical protein